MSRIPFQITNYKLQIIFALLCVIYFFTRLYHLTLLPIFGDEAIYLNWAQTISEDSQQFFIPLSDGKQPLFMWLVALTTFVIHNPLIATRFVAVLAGFASMIGCYLVVKSLSTQKTGLWAMLFYIVTPQLFFYDRIGEPDGLLATFGIYAIYGAIRLARRSTLRNAIIVGLICGIGYFAKSPALFFIVLLPSIFLIKKNLWQSLRHDLPLIGVAGIIAFVCSQLLRVSPLYYQIAQRQQDFVFGPTYILTNYFQQFIMRIPEVASWHFDFLRPMVCGFFIIGLVWGAFKKKPIILFLTLWWFVPLALEMELAKGFTPRYYLFTIAPFIMVAALGFAWVFDIAIHRYRLAALLLLLYFVLPLHSVSLLATDLAHAPLPKKERAGYLEDWSSGWGIAEVAAYIKALPVEQQMLIGTEGHFGTLPDGLIVFMRKTPNIHVEGMGQPGEIYQVPEQLYAWLEQGPHHRAFLVVNFSRMHITRPARAGLTLLATYPKVPGEMMTDSLEFYEVVRRPDPLELLEEMRANTKDFMVE